MSEAIFQNLTGIVWIDYSSNYKRPAQYYGKPFKKPCDGKEFRFCIIIACDDKNQCAVEMVIRFCLSCSNPEKLSRVGFIYVLILD